MKKSKLIRNIIKGKGRRGIINAYISYHIRKEEEEQAIKENKEFNQKKDI